MSTETRFKSITIELWGSIHCHNLQKDWELRNAEFALSSTWKQKRGQHYRLTLENPLTVRVLSHMPGKDAKLVWVAGA